VRTLIWIINDGCFILWKTLLNPEDIHRMIKWCWLHCTLNFLRLGWRLVQQWHIEPGVVYHLREHSGRPRKRKINYALTIHKSFHVSLSFCVHTHVDSWRQLELYNTFVLFFKSKDQIWQGIVRARIISLWIIVNWSLPMSTFITVFPFVSSPAPPLFLYLALISFVGFSLWVHPFLFLLSFCSHTHINSWRRFFFFRKTLLSPENIHRIITWCWLYCSLNFLRLGWRLVQQWWFIEPGLVHRLREHSGRPSKTKDCVIPLETVIRCSCRNCD